MDNDWSAWLTAHRDEMIRHLSALVAIPSVSEDRESTKQALAYTLDLAEKLGFRAQSVLDGEVGVIETGPEDAAETLGILTHVDVVAPGGEDAWETDPFTLTERDGRLYGRGTLDDKGMVIASLYAMKAAAEAGTLYKRVQLIIGTREEIRWDDMYAYVEAYPLPDYGFTPDGEFPICNIEKGVCDFQMSFPQEDGSAAPEGLYLCSVDCGVANNVVPGTATAILSDGRSVTATGRAVHSCQPEKGENALLLLVDELKKLPLAENRLRTVLYGVAEAFADIYGSGIGLCSESEYYQGEFVHRNTFSPTVFRTGEGRITVNVNSRYPYGASEDAIAARMEAFAQSLGGALTDRDGMPAVFVSQTAPFLQALAAAYETVSGLKNEYTIAYGGSYAKAMPEVVSWGPIFPGEEDTCHEVNEYISTESLMKNTAIFAEAIRRIACTPDRFK